MGELEGFIPTPLFCSCRFQQRLQTRHRSFLCLMRSSSAKRIVFIEVIVGLCREAARENAGTELLSPLKDNADYKPNNLSGQFCDCFFQQKCYFKFFIQTKDVNFAHSKQTNTQK